MLMADVREKINRELKSGVYAILILKVVSDKEKSYGYEIVKEIERKSGGRMKIGDATVYPVLRYLARKNALESFWSEPNIGVPRKYYRISEYGKSLLNDLKNDWKELRDTVDEILEVKK